ncbi:ribonuclease Z [Mycobacterium yunnanensis]|uniref:Ribonuclease Z n=1 Tax=Mycobacterium yunnanensis TaxID=368477 RepID=A0A9X3C510_9MYCO|nr:ribonuclease Z [Mycobacterium yunnanensis]MCV7424087.1 ribonuclease Z [Mycobacterium yunnanensis]
MIDVTLLGTGSPMVDPHRAGPATLVQAGGQTILVDCGRGVLMRAAAIGVGAANVSALLLTHLHSDHITDLSDVITTRWISTFARTPLPVFGPPGTAAVVEAVLASLAPDVGYRVGHHADITEPPVVEVHEVTDGTVWDVDGVTVAVGPTDHRPVEPTIGFRVEYSGASVVVAGDTVPCAGVDILSADADALVHTVIRKDLIARVPNQRLQDILDYHSSVEQAADTAARAGVGTLILTHYVPALIAGQEDDWRALAATAFAGRVELGDDLLRVEVRPTPAG